MKDHTKEGQAELKSARKDTLNSKLSKRISIQSKIYQQSNSTISKNTNDAIVKRFLVDAIKEEDNNSYTGTGI